MNDALQFLILLGAIQGIVLAGFVVFPRGQKRSANNFLGSLLLLYSIDMGIDVLLFSPFHEQFIHLYAINDPMQYLYGPLLYLYCVSLVVRKDNPLDFAIVHFFPAVFLFMIDVPFYSWSAEDKLADWMLYQKDTMD